jgi:hypothetical protein
MLLFLLLLLLLLYLDELGYLAYAKSELITSEIWVL